MSPPQSSKADALPAPRELLQTLEERRKRNDWRSITHLQRHLPAEGPLQEPWLTLCDALAFAHGQLGAFEQAIPLAERAFAEEPTARRASGCAYLHYAAAMAWVAPEADRPPKPRRKRKRKKKGGGQGKPAHHPQAGGGQVSSVGQRSAATRPDQRPTPEALPYRERMRRAGFDKQRLREGFLRWVEQALALHGEHPSAIKDLYRLGIFHAQVEQQKDKLALRALLTAIERYRALDEATRRRRHDLHKTLVRCLYAAGRSALRLGKVGLARRLSFQCIREDEGRDHLEPVHKFGLAGRVCLAAGEPHHAERAFRKALEAAGPRPPDYLYGYLAEAALARGEAQAARLWIERHTRPERRSAALWRRLGQVLEACGEPQAALAAYESALPKDHGGRHLTLTAIGRLHLRAGRLDEAERAFKKANDFRRKRFSSEHREALEGLRAVHEARGRKARAAELSGHLAKVWPEAAEARAQQPPVRQAAGGEGPTLRLLPGGRGGEPGEPEG